MKSRNRNNKKHPSVRYIIESVPVDRHFRENLRRHDRVDGKAVESSIARTSPPRHHSRTSHSTREDTQSARTDLIARDYRTIDITCQGRTETIRRRLEGHGRTFQVARHTGRARSCVTLTTRVGPRVGRFPNFSRDDVGDRYRATRSRSPGSLPQVVASCQRENT